MKNKLKSLVILVTLTFSILTLPLERLFPVVKATYVEGEISIDTVWTLLDSPFIVCQNVTIKEGVTLTIEPGVEVRFGGGPFTIIVNGRLIAKGTEENPIKFTSNKENPMAGDWATLLFNGTGQPPSTLENCVIAYGIDGITVNNGNVTIRKSVIRSSLKNGITLLNGSVAIEQCIVQNNREGGIKVSGGNVTIQNNNITLNRNGISLTGNLANSSVLISRNRVFANNNSGILLEMESSSSSISIRNNTVFLNRYGFLIPTNASTFITRNYIYNNTFGAFYQQGSHTIRFNNICNNTVGVDASPDARVNATQNYWGHKSGPYHESLNPCGKGNPVGGNGVNIDFIFFLTAPIDHKNSPPTAILWTDKTTVALGQNVTFVGTCSYDEDGRVDRYLFDFGDGQNSGWTTLSIFSYTYGSNGSYNVGLQVMDDFGDVSNVTTSTVRVVSDLSPLTVSISLSNHTVDYNSLVIATIYVSFNGTPVESASVNLLAAAKGFYANLTDSTDSTGHCTLTFTAPNVSDVTHIRVMARASKEGYADGSDHGYVMVLPPLNVKITAENAVVYSEETVRVAVNVTDTYMKPVANVSLHVLVDNQTVGEGVTDTSGTAFFNFTAPVVYNLSTFTVCVEAFKELYARGSGTCQIEVHPRILSVNIYPELSEIMSEESTKLFIRVQWIDYPTPAQVYLTSNASDYVILSPDFDMTDLNGMLEVILTARQITANMTVMVNVTAVKEGYVSGKNWTYVHIRPKILTVHVDVNRELLVTDEEVTVSVHVECEGVPVENASVTLSLNFPAFLPLTAFTNAEGNATFALNVVVPYDMVVNMTVKAQKEGYVEGYYTLMLKARLANLTVNVDIFNNVVKPGEHAKIYVYVGRGNRPLENASVTVIPSHGSLTSVRAYTNNAGYCEVPIYIPVGTEPSYVYVTVNVTKYGYNSVEKPNCVYFQIVPETTFPWFILLLVLIPVALLVVFVVLVKLGVIVVSFGEEEKESE